ncbi:MAG: hypothetical protein PCFJNLEI_04046 [Verrucomicrobiae bacterium]|nr:hypothetical protein [Verrucomicrobiae bacterium]
MSREYDKVRKIFIQRARYSRSRLRELQLRLQGLTALSKFPNLTIFAAGSYARLEASQYSDIDLFFLDTSPKFRRLKYNELALFRQVRQVLRELGFPPPSNRGQYLKIRHVQDMALQLGGRSDDHRNHFTTRMLLLLESKPLINPQLYSSAVDSIIECYFRDFPRHQGDFRPVFLVNDIVRYWKTLCLNYENKRYAHYNNPSTITKHKVRNFKLKFSRMTTCFATLAALSRPAPVSDRYIKHLILQTPRERLEYLTKFEPSATPLVHRLLEEYSWFLSLTELPAPDLRNLFADEPKRRAAFTRASTYGDQMFKLLKRVDAKSNCMRYMLI